MPDKKNRQSLLKKWIIKQHNGQLIKGNDQPYFNHLERVAEMAEPFAYMRFETGICHDLFEKTGVTAPELYQNLLDIGYALYEAGLITINVIELTDSFTKSKFPKLSQVERKNKEWQRLANTNSTVQTVKYADLYDNVIWMVKHDRANALSYLQRKLIHVKTLTIGNFQLRQELLNLINSELSILKEAV